MGQDLAGSLDENLKIIRAVFHLPENGDLIVREFSVRTRTGSVRAAILYLKGMVDAQSVRQSLLQPLQQANILGCGVDPDIESIMEKHVAELRTSLVRKVNRAVAGIVEGECVLLVDGNDRALACDVRAPEHRPISESPTEAVVKGPHTGFVENLQTNVSLVRTYIQSPDLVSEYHFLGARSHTPYAIMYLKGIANPKLVEEVRKRITSIRMDYVGPTASLIHIIQDLPRDPFPTHLATERPDTIAGMLVEGHVAILNTSPAAILVPSTIWSLVHSPEDYYVHWVPASAIRLLRWLAVFFTVYGSATYVAVTTFHPAMIPTELLFAIAASRETVPFPAALEVLAMEVAFELVREAGIRIPSIAGPTIGIVGAVVLGQAAVQASIVSPVLVVVVAISGLGSFAIPSYSLSLYCRLAKFVMILAGAFLGIPGLTLTSLMTAAHIMGLRSFGTPVTAPLVPYWPHSPDLVVRRPIAGMTTRPASNRPLDLRRQRSGAGLSGPVPPEPEPGEGAR